MRILHLQVKSYSAVVPSWSFCYLSLFLFFRPYPSRRTTGSHLQIGRMQKYCKYAVPFNASSTDAVISLDAKIASKGRLLRGAQKIGDPQSQMKLGCSCSCCSENTGGKSGGSMVFNSWSCAGYAKCLALAL